MRIWLYTPVLHSALSIEDNKSLAQQAVNLAKETIRSLAYLNSSTELYRRMQAFYHQFLTSSIAVLFLASTHAPLRFSASCRAEFYLALELIKDLSARSWVSQRLWRTVRSLNAYAPHLGMVEEEVAPPVHVLGSDRSTGTSQCSPKGFTAAFGAESQAGSGGPPHSIPSASMVTCPQRLGDPHNGLRLQLAMKRIFEGFTFMGSGAAEGPNAGLAAGGLAAVANPNNGPFAGQHVSASDGGVFRQVRDIVFLAC